MKKEHLGIIGAGAWGTAMAVLQSADWQKVTLWAYESETVAQINDTHQNSTFLPGIELPKNVEATQNLAQLVQTHQTLISAVPSHITRELAQKIKADIQSTHQLVLLTKGIEPDSLKLMSDIYQEVLSNTPHISVLSGPNFAREVASGLPTAAVLACTDKTNGKLMQKSLYAPTFRIYLSTDVVGVQIGSTIKNIIAVASGICDGLNCSLSARAALITRGLAEMKRLGIILGGKADTFLGLAGVGDLILTATGNLSRNYSLGFALGTGSTLQEYLAEKKSVAEAVKNAIPIMQLAEKHNIELPICEAVYDILYSGIDCQTAIKRLLERDLPEHE